MSQRSVNSISDRSDQCQSQIIVLLHIPSVLLALNQGGSITSEAPSPNTFVPQGARGCALCFVITQFL